MGGPGYGSNALPPQAVACRLTGGGARQARQFEDLLLFEMTDLPFRSVFNAGNGRTFGKARRLRADTSEKYK